MLSIFFLWLGFTFHPAESEMTPADEFHVIHLARLRVFQRQALLIVNRSYCHKGNFLPYIHSVNR